MNKKSKVHGISRNIKIEMKRIFNSKFLIISLILILAVSAIFPFVQHLIPNNNESHYYQYNEDDITIDGHVIKGTNPLYGDVKYTKREIEEFESSVSTKIDDLKLEFMKAYYDSAFFMATHIESQEDYRFELSWRREQLVLDRFIYSHIDEPKENISTAINFRFGMDNKMLEEKYYSLSNIEVSKRQNEIEEGIARIDSIVVDNDYLEYYRMSIDDANKYIDDNNEKIKALEKDIVESPENEKLYSDQIKGFKQGNDYHLLSIEMFEYRLQNDVKKDGSDWRDTALKAKQRAKQDLTFFKIVPEEEYQENDYYKHEYKTYQQFKVGIQKKRDKATNKLYVADHSLESMKPDMTYQQGKARINVVSFLWFSLVVAVFGAIIGGGLISREFQSGTIRLLYIRPKTRTKIALSKFVALLITCLGIYIMAATTNIITNGIMTGFTDFTYPNYDISNGMMSFFAYFVPKLLVCSITIVFACATAFFFSVTTKKTAISVAVPLVCFVGCLIVMELLPHYPSLNWVIYTPLAYVNFASFFKPEIPDTMYYYETGRNAVEPILGFGIPLMVVLSLVFICFALFINKKRDISN